MEMYKFVKNSELKQSHNLTYHAAELNEITTTVDVYGGISGNLVKSVFTLGIKGDREWARKKSNAVDVDHVVEGDDVPRMIYLVYKFGQPMHNKDREEDLQGQKDVIERLFTENKKYSKYHHKSVDQQFMFFACIEEANNYKWPDMFLVCENDLDLHNLEQGLEQWYCLTGENVVVKRSNAYIKFKSTPSEFSKESIMIYAYLNSVRKSVCQDCTHVWSLPELLDLLKCKQIYEDYPNNVNNKMLDIGYQLQKKHGNCKLWNFYLPQYAFARKSDDSVSCLQFLKRILSLTD